MIRRLRQDTAPQERQSPGAEMPVGPGRIKYRKDRCMTPEETKMLNDFAKSAMIGLLAGNEEYATDETKAKYLADHAYIIAKAMMAESRNQYQ